MACVEPALLPSKKFCLVVVFSTLICRVNQCKEQPGTTAMSSAYANVDGKHNADFRFTRRSAFMSAGTREVTGARMIHKSMARVHSTLPAPRTEWSK